MPSAFPLAVAMLVWAAVAPGAARAGNISISISPRVTLEEGNVVGHVRISNGGDEAAHSVTPTLRLGDRRARGDVTVDLPPKGVVEPVLSVPAADLGPGRWAYEITVDYTDANQYPFQALHVGAVTLENTPPAKVVVAGIESEPVAGRGVARVRLKNLAGVERKATVRVLVPEGLEATGGARDVTIAPWQEQTVSVPLVNRTALAGSRYPVFAAVSYDDEGVHQAAVGQGIVEVRAPQSFFLSQQRSLWIAAGVLLAAWLGFVAWWSLGRRRRAERRA
jgi:hypothetical protein